MPILILAIVGLAVFLYEKSSSAAAFAQLHNQVLSSMGEYQPADSGYIETQLIAPTSGSYFGSLNAAAISQYAARAGFQGEDIATATAIALAESSGNPGAIGDNGNSFGLWQINKQYHPEFAGQNLNDPQTNANAAFAVYMAAGFSFRPWSTYNNGAYAANLAQARMVGA